MKVSSRDNSHSQLHNRLELYMIDSIDKEFKHNGTNVVKRCCDNKSKFLIHYEITPELDSKYLVCEVSTK